MTSQVRAERSQRDCKDDKTANDVYKLSNTSDSVVDTHLLVIVEGLPARVKLVNASGMTHDGKHYIRVFLNAGVLTPGQHIEQRLSFTMAGGKGMPDYSLKLLSGQGTP